MSDIQRHLSPEVLVKPSATILGGAFLLSPFGIPFFVRGVPRIVLAGLGGFLAGKVADKVVSKFADNLGQIIQQRSEENG